LLTAHQPQEKGEKQGEPVDINYIDDKPASDCAANLFQFGKEKARI
jgi:hypothetical protein